MINQATEKKDRKKRRKKGEKKKKDTNFSQSGYLWVSCFSWREP